MATIEEALSVAVDHHAAGRLEEAGILYGRILDVDPDNAPALHLAGVLACQTGHPETALDLLGRAVRQAPGAAAYRIDRAKALAAVEDWSGAAATLSSALMLAPNHAEAWTLLALARHHTGDTDAAVGALERANRLVPDRPDVVGRLALLYQQRGRARLQSFRQTLALADFRRAVRLAPSEAGPWLLLASALLDSGRFAAAAAAYRRALASDPMEGSAFHALGLALGKSGLADRALTALGRAARLDPGNVAVRDALDLATAPGRPLDSGSTPPDLSDFPAEVVILSDGPGGPLLAERAGRHGMMRFFPGDAFVGRSLALYGEYSDAEHRLAAMLVEAGDTVVEAGANIGAHTVPLARTVGPAGRIHAFEPQRVVHDLLAHNLAANRIGNVVLHCSAVGEAPGHIGVPVPDYGRAGNFGAVSMGTFAGEVVPVETVDGLGLDRLGLLKADVEGMEALVPPAPSPAAVQRSISRTTGKTVRPT